MSCVDWAWLFLLWCILVPLHFLSDILGGRSVSWILQELFAFLPLAVSVWRSWNRYPCELAWHTPRSFSFAPRAGPKPPTVDRSKHLISLQFHAAMPTQKIKAWLHLLCTTMHQYLGTFLYTLIEYANPFGPKSKLRIFDSADIGGEFNSHWQILHNKCAKKNFYASQLFTLD